MTARTRLSVLRTIAIEVLIALAITGPVIGQFRFLPERVTLWGAAAALAPIAFLWLRRRHPLAVLVACTVLFCIAAFQTWLNPFSLIALMCAMYAYAVATDRRRALIASLLVIVVTVPVALLTAANSVVDPLAVLVAVAVCFAAALGDGIRNRRAYVAEITERALVAEATRESEAARRVAEERLRIARDLHDVVAHQISVISLNAAVASSSLQTRPDAARQALHSIRSASRQVLGDIGDLLAVLRSAGENPAAPQPGLAQLDDLIADFRRAGLDVTLRTEGAIASLSPSTDSVAYRVLQEALTNALKHASESRAHVLLSADAGSLTVLVTNPVDQAAPTGAGHGLLGIRERVAAVRGTVETTMTTGVFRLSVSLPEAGEETA